MSFLKKWLGISRNRVSQIETKKDLGTRGEDLAAAFLQKKGIQILERNYRYGHGEIDIVAREGETLVFVEVKTAATDEYGPPEGWVDARKQRQIGKIAEAYLQEHKRIDVDCRFDVIAVDATKNHGIHHIQNAFWIKT